MYDCCENELISMSGAWDKEKSESLTGFEPMSSQFNTRWVGALSTWATENSWRVRPYTRFIWHSSCLLQFMLFETFDILRLGDNLFVWHNTVIFPFTCILLSSVANNKNMSQLALLTNELDWMSWMDWMNYDTVPLNSTLSNLYTTSQML